MGCQQDADSNQTTTMTDTSIQITAAQILAMFPEVDPFATCLCDLDDAEFVTGGRITDVCRAAGYDESGRKCVNDQSAWGMSIHDWAHTMGI
jgi:hypothetical protein